MFMDERWWVTLIWGPVSLHVLYRSSCVRTTYTSRLIWTEWSHTSSFTPLITAVLMWTGSITSSTWLAQRWDVMSASVPPSLAICSSISNKPFVLFSFRRFVRPVWAETAPSAMNSLGLTLAWKSTIRWVCLNQRWKYVHPFCDEGRFIYRAITWSSVAPESTRNNKPSSWTLTHLSCVHAFLMMERTKRHRSFILMVADYETLVTDSRSDERHERNRHSNSGSTTNKAKSCTNCYTITLYIIEARIQSSVVFTG